MNGGLGVELLLIGVLILINAFFAASEIAIISTSKARIRKLAEEGNRSAQVVLRLVENSGRFLATIQVGVTMVGFFASAIAAVSVAGLVSKALAGAPVEFVSRESAAIALFLVTIIIAFLALVVGELAPKNLALEHAEPFALFVARPIDLMARATAPLIRVLTFSSDLVVALFGGKRRSGLPLVTEEEIRVLVDAGEEAGTVEEDERDMIVGVFDLGETTAREIMVPRTDIVAVDTEASLSDVVDVIFKQGFSRIPVYEENLDNVVGILYAKDILRAVYEGRQVSSIRELARPAYFIPESKKIDELLNDLRQRKLHMAIVVDEYGGTAGLVTLEDLLEEIVGEIQDEYDREESQIERLGEHEAVLDSKVSIHDLNELFDLNIESEDFDTVGGFVYNQLGKIPSPGDVVEVDNLTLMVLSTAGRRIRKIRVVRHPEVTEKGEEGATKDRNAGREGTRPGPASSAP